MIDNLLSPINAKQPAGNCEEEYLPLEELEDIMLKYGSLHQSSINWEKVEVLCMQILQNKCKHYRVLLHLVTYWLNKRGADSLLDSLKLLHGFLDQYWSNGYPKPGNANILYRKKLAEQILFRIDQASPRLLKEKPPHSLVESLNTALPELEQQIKKRKLDSSLKKLNSHLAELKLAPVETKQTLQSTDSSRTAAGAKAAPKLADLGDERQIKQLLFDLADMINRQNANDPLGYQLRRYALWSGIQSAPPGNQQGESELLPPPADIVQEYDELISAGSVTPELLQRIEKSVVASPFWLTGSLYAASVLQTLNHQNVALAVLQAIEELLQRLPALAEGKFRGGVPYINQNLLNKLQAVCAQDDATNRHAKPTKNPSAMEWEALEKEWHALRKKQGLASVLQQIEKHQHKANTPRQLFYLKLLAGEQLSAAGLKHTAKDMLATTLERVEAMPVSEWEPNYLRKVKSVLEGK
jgi:type VI secretion system protein VasJ